MKRPKLTPECIQGLQGERALFTVARKAQSHYFPFMNRRAFIRNTCAGALALSAGSTGLVAQSMGHRPVQSPQVKVLNPRDRVPVGLIIDDSTCLVNLNRFAMPQFNEAHGGRSAVYHREWREWPAEIPDAFVRKFGEWCANQGVKGKYSIVPYPACVGRLDRELPGWSRKELNESLKLVREVMTANWDIHPEMVTHTRVIDLKTGHPYPDYSLKFMENWEWTTGRSVDELAGYMAYALRILKEAGLTCEGITTPGGFGNRVLPELSQAALQSVRDVYSARIPHYFRHLYDSGSQSVAPRVEYASGLNSADPQCVVSIVGCTGDWTGGWDCTPPEGADRFISADLQRGRMVDVINRGEPAFMVCHWTGIYWNGLELGFKVFQEVVRRLHQRFDNLIWMKLSEASRYWAAKELSSIQHDHGSLKIVAPFACQDFTVQVASTSRAPIVTSPAGPVPMREVSDRKQLTAHSWFREGKDLRLCFDLEQGETIINMA